VALKPTTLHYHVDVGVGGRASHGARRAAADLDLAPRELRLLRRVSVRILRPVRYALGRRELSAARAAVAASCPGLFAASARLQQIDAILVADVAVEVRFKANVSFEDRMALLGRLGVSFGFGAGQATGYAWSGKNVVFAARLGHVRPGSNGRKQASAR
jgi:hypothetical protein